MNVGAVVAFLVVSGVGGQEAGGPGGPGPRMDAWRVGAGAVEADSTKPRRKAVRLSEAYAVRRQVHKLASFATIPLFVAEYVAGEQLIKKGRRDAGWAGDYHGVGAGVIAGLFGVNTLTGGLNWWETRNQTDGRTWRTVHTALMLLADAGFVATGALASDGEGPSGNQGNQNRTHRAVAIGSMSVATVSYLMMLKPLRRD